MFFNIIILTYNSSKYLSKCLNSVATQNFSDFEILIIDKFSTDDTPNIINKFIESKVNIKIHKINLGLYESLNFAYQRLNSKYTLILHSDDYLKSKDSLLQIFNFIKKKKNPDALYSNLKIFRGNKIIRNWISGEIKKKKIMYGWMPPHPTIVIKSEIISCKSLKYDTTYKISADYDFFLNLYLNYKIKFTYFNYHYYMMRIGGVSSKNIKSQIIKLNEDRIICKIHKLPIYSFLLKRILKLIQFT